MTLIAPGVELNLRDNSAYTISTSTTTPLIFIATRGNKTNPNGDAIALGTQEGNILRAVTSQRDVLQAYGTPTFVTSSGAPVHGDETNEYGLHALWSYMATSNLAYVVRADIDLKGLEPSTVEPTTAPADGTFWLDSDSFVGGMYRRNAANTAWEPVSTTIYTETPEPEDGDVGDIVFDYSTNAGTILIKIDEDPDEWVSIHGDLTDYTIDGRVTTSDNLFIKATTPTGAGANDYWWKTSEYSHGIKQYRAADGQWIDVDILLTAIDPLDYSSDTIWMDLGTVNTNGGHIIYQGDDDDSFVALTYTINNKEPVLPAAEGDLWYNDDFTSIELRHAVGSLWVLMANVTTNTPTNAQISLRSVAPTTPATGGLWLDLSDLENYPLIRRWNGVSWEDISGSIRTDYVAPAAAVGEYYLNMDSADTAYTVKEWDPEYVPKAFVDNALITPDAGAWKPVAGIRFGRKAQRFMISQALQQAVLSTEGLGAEGLRYALAAAPAYPELYDELVNLAASRKDQIHVIADVPFSMKPAGIPTGREILATDWKSNSGGASETGEEGFASSGTWTASHYYPHGMSTNSNGQTVFVPSSTLALRMLQYADSVRGIGHPSFGFEAGVITNATSVGYLTAAGTYRNLSLSEGEAGVLYNSSINSFMNYFNVGLRNMGNKTAYGIESKLSEQHIARLVSKMKFDLAMSLRRFLGKLNNAETWAMARNAIERYLAGLSTAQLLEDWAVRVDEGNNTAERRNRRELWVEVAIIPTSGVEFIYIDLGINASGDVI